MEIAARRRCRWGPPLPCSSAHSWRRAGGRRTTRPEPTGNADSRRYPVSTDVVTATIELWKRHDATRVGVWFGCLCGRGWTCECTARIVWAATEERELPMLAHLQGHKHRPAGTPRCMRCAAWQRLSARLRSPRLPRGRPEPAGRREKGNKGREGGEGGEGLDGGGCTEESHESVHKPRGCTSVPEVRHGYQRD